MKRYITLLFFAGIITLFHSVSKAQNWSPEHVYYGKGGTLTYTPDVQGNIIPDFSHVGYRYGDEPIPDIATVLEVYPVEGDDGATIQTAIESLYTVTPDENGFRGAVLLKAGTYQVSGQIKIAASGIVLRGEGDTDEGTVIIAEGTSRRDLILVDNGASRIVDAGTKVNIKEAYVPVGRKYVIVDNAAGFAEGDEIVLYRPGTPNWISDIKMDQITPSEGTTQWNASSYSFYFERLVTRVSGDTIFFRNPVVMAMETKYGGGAVYKFSFNRLENIGIENICLKSAYTSDTDEEHSWNAVMFHSVENGWVRNVTSWYFAYSCVNLERKSRLITVENSHCRDPKSIITGARRYSFNLNGSFNLFKGCTTTEGRHDFVTGSRVCGPNVFVNCSASNTHADIGPHHRWAMGTLYDAIVSDGEINVQDRDDMGSGHGWAGANQVFWNCTGSASICQNPWASAKNYNFGFQGEKKPGARAGRPDGVWVGHNVPGIFPASLYEAQLEQRLQGTTVFSAISHLEQINDSSFKMSFTMPLNASEITPGNFVIDGTAGIGEKPFTVQMSDDYSVIFTFTGLGILPTFSTVVISAETLTSKDGKQIEGIIAAQFTEPDKRPVVTGVELMVDNETGFAVASTSKPGTMYIIKFGSYPTAKNQLDSLVVINQGRSVEAPVAGVSVPIYTQGLPGGYYNYYASDEDGRVSLPDSRWLQVNQTGPITANGPEKALNQLKVYLSRGQIVVDPDSEEVYSIEIFTVTGQLLYRSDEMTGRQYIDHNGYSGIAIIRKQSGAFVSTVKIFIY